MKIKEVIEKILAYHPHLEGYRGCDDYKSGDPEMECTGVVTALTPNIAVIRKAIELNANLIVVHEPTYYTSQDGPGWFEDFDNKKKKKKHKLLEQHKICIWRDHDHMHANDPDSIFTGVLKYMGWLDKAKVDRDTGLYAHFLVDLEECSVRQLAQKLIDTIGLNGARIVGDENAIVKKAALVGHLYPQDIVKKDGSKGEYSIKVIEAMENGVDVIIPGETIDWTVLSYIRDAYELGKNKAAILIGHFNWEELGMKYMQEWLFDLIEGQIPVTYVPSGDMYHYIKEN